MSLADVQSLIDDLVRDRDGVVSTTQRDRGLRAAVLRYSADRPRSVVADVVSAGGMQLDLPAGWQAEFSVLLAVEYPVGDVPPNVLDRAGVSLYQPPSPAALKIQLPVSLAAGDSARITYTAQHAVDSSVDTVPEHHRHAVACYAAAMICGELAGHYATSAEPTIQADAVDHRSKSDLFRSRERDLRARYLADLGIDDKKAAVASTVVNLQGQDSRGNDRLFHGRRYR